MDLTYLRKYEHVKLLLNNGQAVVLLIFIVQLDGEGLLELLRLIEVGQHHFTVFLNVA